MLDRVLTNQLDTVEGHPQIATGNGLDAKASNGLPDVSRKRTSFLVGVAGGTRAGKTTFVQRLSRLLAISQTVIVIDLNSYHRDFNHLPVAERERINIDQPDSFDLACFREALSRLREGRTSTPVYGFETYTRYPGSSVLAGNVVIAEGPMLFVDERVRNLFDLKVFVETPADIRVRRRLEYDVRERGCTIADAIDHYIDSVLPMHLRFIEPTRALADLVVSGWEDNEIVLAELVAAINSGSQQQESLQPASTEARRNISGSGVVSNQRG